MIVIQGAYFTASCYTRQPYDCPKTVLEAAEIDVLSDVLSPLVMNAWHTATGRCTARLYRLYCGHNGNKSAGLGNLKRNTIIVCMSERRNAVVNKSVVDMKEEFHEREK